MKSKIVIVGTGPTLDLNDLSLTKDHNVDVMAINTVYQIATWANYLYCCDYDFIAQFYDDISKNYVGQCYTANKKASVEFGWRFVPSRDEKGLSHTKNYINLGSNSGFQAINLAVNLGYTDIGLLGFTVGRHDNKAHYFGDYSDKKLKKRPNYDNWIRHFELLAVDLELEGIRIHNCTRISYLTCFGRQSVSDFIHA